MTRTDDLHDWTCATLAALFDRVPQTLTAPPDADGALADAARVLVRAFSRSPRQETEADQVRLFVNAAGGVPAPPYASWYLDGAIGGPAADYAAAAYARQRLVLADDAGEPPDVVGAELEFLAFLGRHAMAARATGDGAALAAVLDARDRFLREHVSRWFPSFVSAIRAATPGPVYEAAATLLEQWLNDVERWRA